MKNRVARIEQFIADCGWSTANRIRIAGDASNRKYDRLTKPDGSSAILMDAPPETGEDVRPFVSIADHLRTTGLSAPAIYHQDPVAGFLLIQDFGDALFADLMAEDPAEQIPLYCAAADVLIHLADVPPPSVPSCDANWLTEMTAPAFEWYAQDPVAQAEFSDLFHPFAQQAASGKQVLILRDYHVQNLLLLPDHTGIARVGLLDFQDAMRGHPAYDLVSILQDARRDVSPEIEAEIIEYTLAKTDMDKEAFRTAYAILGLQRNLRILGIFARLCLRDGKVHYVDFIPRVWGYILRNLRHPDLSRLTTHLMTTLPEPTPIFLEQLKNRCPKTNTQ